MELSLQDGLCTLSSPHLSLLVNYSAACARTLIRNVSLHMYSITSSRFEQGICRGREIYGTTMAMSIRSAPVRCGAQRCQKRAK